MDEVIFPSLIVCEIAPEDLAFCKFCLLYGIPNLEREIQSRTDSLKP